MSTKFAIKVDEGLYVRTDIDSSGMSVMLAIRPENADQFDTEAEALKFIARCKEPAAPRGLRNAALKAVPC